MNEQLQALKASAAHLRSIVEALDSEQLTKQAYPTEWTIAKVLSHIGSGAIITRHAVDAAVAGTAIADGYHQSVWDVWNAKSPDAQAADALAADRDLLDRIDALSTDERTSLQFSMGPMSLDLIEFLGLRLNEHTLHTWDIEVVLDPTATLLAEATGLVIDNLGLVARFAGKSDGVDRVVTVHTSEPDRDFTVTTTAEAVSLERSAPAGDPSLAIPAEAFIRLLYGRLDPGHAPDGLDSSELESLRSIFPGV
jgi:uncharacterized protein (TIGR03083 family)